jgi:Na+-driven multidrug efflux pump
MEEMLPPENPMGTTRISGLVLKTGLPLMISLLINSLYNFVDSVFVARISEEALTALSLAAPVQIIMSAMGLGIAVGLNAVISRALGEKNGDRVMKTASAALVLAFLAWVLVVMLEITVMKPYFRWQSGGAETIMGYGIPYLRIMAVSYLLSNVCLTFSSAFQGLGMGVQSMLLTLSRQVIIPVLLIAAASGFGELSLIWWAFVLAEALVIPAGMILWKKESGKV